jgi:hypothetical protein
MPTAASRCSVCHAVKCGWRSRPRDIVRCSSASTCATRAPRRATSRWRRRRRSPQAISGADGSFELPAPIAGGRAHLAIEAAGFVTSRVALEDAVPPASITVDRGRHVVLRLAEGEGTRIASVRYDVFEKHGEGWKRDDGIVTLESPAPSVELRLPRGERGRLYVTLADGREAKALEVDLTDGRERFDLTVEAWPFRTMRGVVKGPSGKPIAGAVVTLGKPNERSLLPRPSRAVRTAEDGSFEFDGLSPGPLAAYAALGGGISPPRPFGVAGDRDPDPIEITMAVATQVTVELTRDGEPLRATPVYALRFERLGQENAFHPYASAATLDDGRAVLELGLGSYLLAPLPPPRPLDGAFHDWSRRLEEFDARSWPHRATVFDSTPQNFTIALASPRESLVLGTVAVNGRPLPFARVTLTPKPQPGREAIIGRPVFADARGRFRCHVALRDERDEYDAMVSGDDFHARLPVELAVSEEFVLDLDVAAGSVAGTIEVSVDTPGPLRAVLEGELTDDERRVRLASPTSRLDDTPWAARLETLVGADGAYRFDVVPVGHYRVALEDVSRFAARVATDPFDVKEEGAFTPSPLVAPAATTLVARMVGSDLPEGERLPFASLLIRAADGAPPLPRTFVGWFAGQEAKVEGLPPGRVVVSLIPYGNFVAGEPVEIELRGGAAEVALEVRAGP